MRFYFVAPFRFCDGDYRRRSECFLPDHDAGPSAINFFAASTSVRNSNQSVLADDVSNWLRGISLCPERKYRYFIKEKSLCVHLLNG